MSSGYPKRTDATRYPEFGALLEEFLERIDCIESDFLNKWTTLNGCEGTRD